MKFNEINMVPIQSLIDEINAKGCTYASLTINCTGKSVRFNIYTPETSHRSFDTQAELVTYLAEISGSGPKSVAVALAHQAIADAHQIIESAKERIESAKDIIAESEIDADGVPV